MNMEFPWAMSRTNERDKWCIIKGKHLGGRRNHQINNKQNKKNKKKKKRGKLK